MGSDRQPDSLRGGEGEEEEIEEAPLRSLNCHFHSAVLCPRFSSRCILIAEQLSCEFLKALCVFSGTCVCGECSCYDVDPSGDWGDIHGDTCECDERNCHATYDRYTDDFCSGKPVTTTSDTQITSVEPQAVRNGCVN